MKECLQWTSTVEFERLRAQLTLGSCTAISCASVSRIEPKHESEWIEPDDTVSSENSLPTVMNGTLLTREEIERFGLNVDILLASQDCLEIEESIIKTKEVETFSDEPGSDDERGLENLSTEEKKKEAEDERVRSKSIKASSSSLVETKALTKELLGKEDKEKRHGEEQAYSQIWMCGRDQKKGLLSVFIFPDRQKTSSVSLSSL